MKDLRDDNVEQVVDHLKNLQIVERQFMYNSKAHYLKEPRQDIPGFFVRVFYKNPTISPNNISSNEPYFANIVQINRGAVRDLIGSSFYNLLLDNNISTNITEEGEGILSISYPIRSSETIHRYLMRNNSRSTGYIEGLEEIVAACHIIGDNNIIPQDIMVTEEDNKVTLNKINHETSILRSVLDNFSENNFLGGLQDIRRSIGPIYQNNFLSFNIEKYVSSLRNMVDKLTEENIDNIIENRLNELNELGFNFSSIVNDRNFLKNFELDELFNIHDILAIAYNDVEDNTELVANQYLRLSQQQQQSLIKSYLKKKMIEKVNVTKSAIKNLEIITKFTDIPREIDIVEGSFKNKNWLSLMLNSKFNSPIEYAIAHNIKIDSKHPVIWILENNNYSENIKIKTGIDFITKQIIEDCKIKNSYNQGEIRKLITSYVNHDFDKVKNLIENRGKVNNFIKTKFYSFSKMINFITTPRLDATNNYANEIDNLNKFLSKPIKKTSLINRIKGFFNRGNIVASPETAELEQNSSNIQAEEQENTEQNIKKTNKKTKKQIEGSLILQAREIGAKLNINKNTTPEPTMGIGDEKGLELYQWIRESGLEQKSLQNLLTEVVIHIINNNDLSYKNMDMIKKEVLKSFLYENSVTDLLANNDQQLKTICQNLMKNIYSQRDQSQNIDRQKNSISQRGK